MLRRAGYTRSSAALLRDERRLRIIGDWGGASGHIGKRWEEMGTAALRQWVQLHEPASAVAELASRAELRDLFDALGMTNPDTVLVSREDDSLLLRPVDLKWTLEVASYRQISAAALKDLVAAAGPPLASVIASTVGGGEGECAIHCPASREIPANWKFADGFFFAVDSEANRRYLTSDANARQEYPIEQSEVVFQAVDPREFFGSLPGWGQALRLATLDRSLHALASIDRAAGYYRLGAGVRGALLKLKASVFSPEPSNGDVEQEVEQEMEALIARRRLASSADVVASLEPELARRAERQQRLRDLCRSPFSFEQFKSRLSSRGLDLDSIADHEKRIALIERYRLIARRHRDRVVTMGQSLVQSGLSDTQALAALEKRADEFQRRAAADAEQVLADL